MKRIIMTIALLSPLILSVSCTQTPSNSSYQQPIDEATIDSVTQADSIADTQSSPVVSMGKMLNFISTNFGKGGRVGAEYHGMADNLEDMYEYAETRITMNTDPNLEPYGNLYNNCYTFSAKTVNRGYNMVLRPIKESGAHIDPMPDWPAGRQGTDVI